MSTLARGSSSFASHSYKSEDAAGGGQFGGSRMLAKVPFSDGEILSISL